MKENYPKIFIILLNWNGWEDTIDCIKSIQKITYPNYELVICDNDSTDGSVLKIINWYERDLNNTEKEGTVVTYIQYIKNKFEIMENRNIRVTLGYKALGKLAIIQTGRNMGFAGGNNIGIKYCLEEKKANYVFLLNNDTLVDKGFLEPLVEILENNSNVGIVGPGIYYDSQKNILNFAGGKVSLWKGVSRHLGDGRKSYSATPVEEDYQEGSAMLIKKEVFQKVGLLDESYFLFWEDTDFCYRAKKEGYKVVCVPASKIWHKIHGSSGGTTKSSPLLTYHKYRSRMLFMKKHAAIYHWPSIIVILFAMTAKFIALCIIKRKQFGVILKEIGAILSGLKNGLIAECK